MIYTNVFEYDIKSAHPNILNKMGYSFKDDWYKLEDKLDRNIYIGKLFRDDLALRIKVNSYVESLIFNFMYENNHLDDIIMVLYDALFTKTYIEDDIIKNYKKETDILIRLKNKFDIFLIIHKRARKFIGFNKSKCVLKGFTKTKGIEEFLYNNLYLEIINDKPLGLIMEKLQEKFMNSNNIDLFKLQKHNTEYIIIDNKEIEYNNQQIEELDKIYYLNHIIKPIMDNMIIDLFQKEQYEKFKNIYKK
jgi:hypothetical protein